jgi:hypothetical protein
MPLNPDSPNTKDVEGPVVSKNLTKMHIHEFRVILDPNAAAGSKVQLYVKWSEGYEEGDPAVYHFVNMHSKAFSGQALEDELNENTTGGSYYGEVKAKLWGWLQDQGEAPAGNIT